MKPVYYFFLLVVALVIVTSCGMGRAESEDINSEDRYHSERFTLEKREGYTALQISNPWQGAKNVVQNFYLVSSPEIIEEVPSDGYIIEVPVSSVVCLSTTHLAMFGALGRRDVVSGFSGTSFIYDTIFRMMVDEGRIREVGYEGNLNKEVILDINPDLVIAYGVEGETAAHVAKLREMGIKILFNADHIERDPVARLEWIKVIGALLCKEELAAEIYSRRLHAYDSIASYIKDNMKIKPGVMLGLPWRDSWYISPGNSYIGALISDAGGRYLWSELRGEVTMPYSLESVFVKADKADFWLNTGSALSLKEVESIAGRVSLLPVFKSGNLYNNNKRINRWGGNDYWEGAVICPDTLLMDIGSILHPELFPGYSSRYYERLKK